MSAIILADRQDVQQIIDEEKEIWVYDVLVALGAAEDVLVSIKEEDMSQYLSLLEMEVWNVVGGSVDVFRKGKIVAQWKAPKLTLIKEGKDKYYYEIQLNEWALPFQMKKRGE